MSEMKVDLIPRETLFGNPEKASPQISPDGTRMGYIAPVDGVLNVWVGTVGKDDYAPVTKDTDRGVRAYGFAHDNRHLVYIQDQGGDENWRLYTVDLETGEIVDRTPFDGVQAQIIGMSKRHPNDVLIGLNKDNPQLHDVYHLDLATGELTKRFDNPGFVGWVPDAQLKVLCGIAFRPDGGLDVMVRDTEDADWRKLIDFDAEDALPSGPVGYTLDGKAMYLTSSKNANAGRLIKVDVATGETLEVIAEDPRYDVGGVQLHPDTREVQIVNIQRDRNEIMVLDESIRDDVERITALHHGELNFLGRDHADNTWLVAFNTDDGPIPYYAYDRSTKQATFLFVQRSDLERYTLANCEPFSFTSRDGLEVHGYLSFPPGVERTNLPAILNVHGGPWGRDVWGYHPEWQWMANRGYLCVAVNFRGSTGYGKQFVNAGDKAWGAEMHDDLLDAIDHIVGNGYADPKRIGIYGGSYGGYVALVGATFTPERFTCAVDIVGPSSLKTLIESIPPYWAPMVAMFHERVGNPETEEDFLWSRSPLSKVDNVSIPLLIAQGANDPRVKQAEAEQIVDALKTKGIPHEYMLFPDEGHGFAKPENRLKFYAAAEQFLAQHLGGRAEA